MEELIGPNLNLMSKQSNLALKLLGLFVKKLYPDKLYTERIKRHYKQFKEEFKRQDRMKKNNTLIFQNKVFRGETSLSF